MSCCSVLSLQCSTQKLHIFFTKNPHTHTHPHTKIAPQPHSGPCGKAEDNCKVMFCKPNYVLHVTAVSIMCLVVVLTMVVFLAFFCMCDGGYEILQTS